MIDRTKLATAVRTRRGDQSLRKAAKESGVPHSTMQRIEAGESSPDLDTFTRLCRWMRMPMDFFVLEETTQHA